MSELTQEEIRALPHRVVDGVAVLLTQEEIDERAAEEAALAAEHARQAEREIARVNREASDQRRREQRVDELQRLVDNGASQESINRALLALLKEGK